jgi:hypothetical protein
MQLTRHAIEKCATYGVDAAAVLSAIQGRYGESNKPTHSQSKKEEWAMDGRKTMSLPMQLRQMQQSVDPDTGAILIRHPLLRGLPDLVIEGEGYTLEFIGPTLLCLDITDPGALGKLLAEPVKEQLPAGL